MRWQWCAGSTMCGVSFAKEPYSGLFRKRKFLEWSSCIPPPFRESVACNCCTCICAHAVCTYMYAWHARMWMNHGTLMNSSCHTWICVESNLWDIQMCKSKDISQHMLILLPAMPIKFSRKWNVVGTISRLLQIIGLFCRISSPFIRLFCKRDLWF